MRLLRRPERELERCYGQDATAEVNRLVNASARPMRAYQEGLLTLGRTRTGGRQVVQAVHQHLGARGGQAGWWPAASPARGGGLGARGTTMKTDRHPGLLGPGAEAPALAMRPHLSVATKALHSALP
jgi:hypothetical protein